jgi:hypothetical protein
MKQGLLVLILIALVAAGAAALDFGGTLDSATTVEQASETTLDEEATLAGWVRQKVGDALEIYARGSYTYTIDTPVLVDLDAAWFKGEWDKATGPTLLELTVGRFKTSDFSHLVLDHTIDGLETVFTYPSAVFRATAGYTGLVQKPRSDIVISKADARDIDRTGAVFAPPRLVGLFDVSLLNVAGSQTVKLAMLFQEDLRPEDGLKQEGDTAQDITRGGRLSTQYLGAFIGGPLGGGLYYDLYGYGNTGQMLSWMDSSLQYQYKPIAAFLAGGGLRFFGGPMSSVFGLRGILASGDEDARSVTEGNEDGLALGFVPISQTDRALVFSPQLTNLVVGEASYSLKPFDGLGIRALTDLQAVLTALVFARPTTGAASQADPASDSLYLGTEVDLVVNYRPFSDLGIALKGGVFLPGDALGEQRTDPEYLVGLLVSLSF